MTYINIIVACDKNLGIGKNNTIPWYNKEDMQIFKKYTIGNGNNAIIMGRKTLESIPNIPLNKRKHLVLSHTLKSCKNYNVYKSKEDLLEHNKHYDELWVIGGSEIYKLFLMDAKYVYQTIQNNYYNCDTFFPKLPKEFKVIEQKKINDESILFINQNMDYR